MRVEAEGYQTKKRIGSMVWKRIVRKEFVKVP